ncbi:MAG: YdcF family protein [Sandaracinus sp.]|nr:YdcF family protein [Myxococcales bacterium]MCB9603683.1 YdcF family protein [Sandaracinus sp.]MCB9612601.1 YdcF family protein [Sandaracinus sp.]MCB9621312.1 YdcF family protein [Sandaracinus sp.]MCB9622780.1 YdcF family protein [Sandaracinus sp.]
MLLVWMTAAAWLDRRGLRTPEGSFDAIVVAGCRVMPDGRPSPALARRAELATELWRGGLAPRVVFTGGVGDHGGSEASVAAAHARSRGLRADAVWLEERSTSTEENARYAAEVLADAGLPRARVLVVSDSYHVLRCERVFGRRFDEVVGTGSRSVPYARAKGAMREVPVLIAYALLGRL